MNPTSSDDDWNDLARELGVDKSATPPPEPHAADMVERQIEEELIEPHHGTDERVEEEVFAEGEPEAAAEEDVEPEDESAMDAAEPMAEGQSGTGRKRRRRRRRRRKGGAPAEGAAFAEAEGEEVTESEEVFAPTAEAEAESEEFGAEEMESDFAPLAAEEDTASDVLRDLIANWNVPSWDDIVTGLYRPG